MPDYLICPRIPHKQIELWGITSTSGNFRNQTANIHLIKRLKKKKKKKKKDRVANSENKLQELFCKCATTVTNVQEGAVGVRTSDFFIQRQSS